MNKSSIQYNKSRCKCISFPSVKLAHDVAFILGFWDLNSSFCGAQFQIRTSIFLDNMWDLTIHSEEFVPPPLLKLSIFMIPCVLDILLVSSISMLFPSFFMLSRIWLFLALFYRQWNLHSHCPESLTDVSLYQQSNSCHPVSEKPRNLLVSFHLGRYHSDKQITFPNSQKNLCMWSVHCHFPFRNLSSFWCFYHQG